MVLPFYMYHTLSSPRSCLKAVLTINIPDDIYSFHWLKLCHNLSDAIESVQKRVVRIVLPNCHYNDALIQSGITALSQRREEACTNFIKRDCLSSPVFRPLIPCVSIDRPYCLGSGECAPVRFVPKTNGFADFSTIKYENQL